MKAFKSIEEIKSRGEFFKAGKIIPVRILKVTPKKHSHTIKFNCDSWAIPTPKGYLIYSENVDNKSPIRKPKKDWNSRDGWFYNKGKRTAITGAKDTLCSGSPYTKNGTTHWYLNNTEKSQDEVLRDFNNHYADKNQSLEGYRLW